MGKCRAWAETTYRLSESSSDFLSKILPESTAADGAIGATHRDQTPRTTLLEVKWNKSLFIKQNDPNLCWAAASAMAFAFSGVKYRQEDFSEVLQAQCGDRASYASLNQMIFALSKVHTGTGVWIVQPNREWSLLPQPLTTPASFMGRSVTWGPLDARGGQQRGVFALSSTTDIVEQIQSNRPVVLGFGTHVVLVVGVYVLTPDPYYRPEALPFLAKFSKIESLVVVDPFDNGDAKVVDSNMALGQSRFAFVVVP